MNDRSASPNELTLHRLSSTNLARTTVHDVSVEVVIAPTVRNSSSLPRKHERKVSFHTAFQASCIISIWSIEDTQYFTLTFTSASTVHPIKSSRPTSRVVNRTNTGAYSNNSRSSASSSSSDHRSGGSSIPTSKAATPVLQQPEFPPRGPPSKSRNDISTSASVFQKATQMKDAILNSLTMPAYGL